MDVLGNRVWQNQWWLSCKTRSKMTMPLLGSSGMITLWEIFFLELCHHDENTKPHTLLSESCQPRSRYARDKFIWKLKLSFSALPGSNLLRHPQLFESILAIAYPHLRLQTLCKRDVIPALLCPNTWSTEFLRLIKLLLYATNLIVYYAAIAISKRNICSLN